MSHLRRCSRNKGLRLHGHGIGLRAGRASRRLAGGQGGRGRLGWGGRGHQVHELGLAGGGGHRGSGGGALWWGGGLRAQVEGSGSGGGVRLVLDQLQGLLLHSAWGTKRERDVRWSRVGLIEAKGHVVFNVLGLDAKVVVSLVIY